MKSLSLDSPESQETLRDKRTMGHGVHACASSSNTPPYEAMADLVAVPYKGILFLSFFLSVPHCPPSIKGAKRLPRPGEHCLWLCKLVNEQALLDWSA